MIVSILSVELADGDMRRYGLVPMVAAVLSEWESNELQRVPVIPLWIQKDEAEFLTYIDKGSLEWATYINLSQLRSWAVSQSTEDLMVKVQP